MVVEGELTVGSRMKASLSADHRVTDGAEACRVYAGIGGLSGRADAADVIDLFQNLVKKRPVISTSQGSLCFFTFQPGRRTTSRKVLDLGDQPDVIPCLFHPDVSCSRSGFVRCQAFPGNGISRAARCRRQGLHKDHHQNKCANGLR